MICLNPQCPDMLRYGFPGEYRDGIRECPKCGGPLEERIVDEPQEAAGEGAEGPPVEDGPAPEPDDRNLENPLALDDEPHGVIVDEHRESHLAYLAESKLIAEGLHPIVVSEAHVPTPWLAVGIYGLTKVVVPESEAEAARAILSEDSAGTLEDDDDRP